MENDENELKFLREAMVTREQECIRLREAFSRIKRVVIEQCEDRALIVEYRGNPTHYVQQALRKLQSAVDNEVPIFDGRSSGVTPNGFIPGETI